MRRNGMPMAMWAVFAKSFEKQLTEVLGYDAKTAKAIRKTAKLKYKEIIAKLPEFEKGDRFQLNIIGCAMLGAFVLCMPKRPDTEVLVDEALPYIQTLGSCRVLALCAGSGCIGLAIAAHAPGVRGVLGEYSDAALKVCRQNVRRCGLTARMIPMQVNALERPDRALGEFQCIVSNPPYIPRNDIPGLDHSVRDYEPHLALDGGEDGLDFYRAICEKWTAALVPGGRLYFEVGIGQADSVLRLMRAQGFGDIQVVKDHNDIPRVVFGTLCSEVYSE